MLRRAILLFAVLYPLSALAETLVLKRQFVEQYKDRTTITAKMTVRHAHTHPNSVGQGAADGDLHFSGESGDVGLPFVAEIVNARQTPQKNAVSLVQQKAAAGNGTVQVAGAWRLWFEHPSKQQVQGGNNPFSPDTTNPDHSFEIHPISGLEALTVLDSFVPVVGYKAYPGAAAFPFFDGVTITARASSSGITLDTTKSKYNYVEFWIELTQNPKKVADGYIALAEVQDENGGEVSAQERRMIFVGNTRAAEIVSKLGTGDRLHVMGIPRINLNAVSQLVQQHPNQQFKAKLPYEMIIVGAFETPHP